MKLSIITPTYNSVRFIEDCLRSVSSQKYNNVEHIVVDGASTDGTLEFLKIYQNSIDILISEEDNGIYHAMNKGISFTTGDVIGFLNSDDVYENDCVLTSVAEKFLENPYLEACYANLAYTSQTNLSKIIRYWKSSEFTPGLFSKGWSPPHPTFFVRRSVFERHGLFNLNYPIVADIDLMIRFLEVFKIKSQYVSELWVKMRIGGASNKNFKNICKQNLDILNILRKNNLAANPLKFFLYKFISRSRQFFNKPS